MAFEISYISSNSGMEIRTLPESRLPRDILLDTEKDLWPNHTVTPGFLESKVSRTCATHVEECKVGVDDLIAQQYALNIDFALANSQIHQTAVFMPHSPTVTQTTSILEPSWIGTISVTDCRKQVQKKKKTHNMGVWIMASNTKSFMARSLAILWVRPNRVPHWRWQLQYKRIIHKEQMDTTGTTGHHHDAHHIYSKQIVGFFCGCESFIFQHEQTCRGIFRCIGKRETKPSSLRCNDGGDINDKNADMDFHAVPPPDY